jgi:hypothetical protein
LLSDVTALALSSNTTRVGHLLSSQPFFNEFIDVAARTISSNLMSVQSGFVCSLLFLPCSVAGRSLTATSLRRLSHPRALRLRRRCHRISCHGDVHVRYGCVLPQARGRLQQQRPQQRRLH